MLTAVSLFLLGYFLTGQTLILKIDWLLTLTLFCVEVAQAGLAFFFGEAVGHVADRAFLLISSGGVGVAVFYVVEDESCLGTRNSWSPSLSGVSLGRGVSSHDECHSELWDVDVFNESWDGNAFRSATNSPHTVILTTYLRGASVV